MRFNINLPVPFKNLKWGKRKGIIKRKGTASQMKQEIKAKRRE